MNLLPMSLVETGIWGTRPNKEEGIAQRVRNLRGRKGQWFSRPSNNKNNIPLYHPWSSGDPYCPL